ncbi:DNA-processing protein DprA [Methylotuvimicrobium buryatense]|uniref:DNA-protecting protein DprA n=1 Tax=Methylotuvimicrobium buryatense TaxID=95641 RepID=A0A4P9UR34_METBY|nr:DNA-processing protein DprA [Methylotuvimicrobium buryatense]QCW83924.1 DNA-protecting protein DprA [Methylotuvimicrobium buryatense]
MRTPGFGCRSFLKTLDSHTPQQLFSESSSGLAALGLKDSVVQAIRNPDWTAVEQDLHWLEQPGHLAVTLADPCYPMQLKEIADPPPLLFIRGNPDILALPQIAIVGSRNPSHLGVETATEFAKALAREGFVITSGLALGIDAAGHKGALQVQGYTIAVAGTGLDRVYPARHRTLATEIVNHGAMISEFPPGTGAKADHFPRRNRIISGLCIGLLVVEAAKQSGSLITARMALEQNREVFAIPGSIHNPLARGCNALIREGAKLVETARDILEELSQYNQQDDDIFTELRQTTLDLEQQTLLNLIMFSPTSIDSLVENTGLPVEVISSMLLVLELQGYVESVSGGCYTRIK